MLKPHLYILQLLGILMLICGYFLSDQPDSLSVMHFDLNPASPLVFSKAALPGTFASSLKATVSSQENTSRKSEKPNYITHEVILTCDKQLPFHEYLTADYAIPLPQNYAYLFFEEINPPPPKLA
jgi:hypothetical protein